MTIEEELRTRVMVLDGAMGTMIQRLGLDEKDFRGTMELPEVIKYRGCNDLLCLTRPELIGRIHDEYIAAGADIIETNSFNANAVSLAEYALEGHVRELNAAAAGVARRSAAKAGRRVYVAGSMGPGNVSLSIARAGKREAGFDMLATAWQEQAEALIEGGVDLLLLETIFDTLNAKAALVGIRRAMKATKSVPLMLSVTLTRSGRTLSGQSVEAFLASVSHAAPLSIGLNCGFGAEEMEEWLEQLQGFAGYVTLHPNAGLPDELGQYTESPETMAATMAKYLGGKKLNIIGGCCGTTPEHIRALAAEARKATPRKAPDRSPDLQLAGIEALTVGKGERFLKVGERCNVAGSRKFLRLISEGNSAEALEIASAQVGKGAKVLDVNMDDALLDAPAEMERFVELLGSDGNTSPLPLMIDSSDFEVIRRALRKIQGRPIVNSISLKEGEEKFLEHAGEIRDMGAAVVVMAFDEQGQATSLQRRIDICRRAYRLLTEKAGFRGEEIIFDPNVLTIATGVAEHDRYALDFLEAVSWIKGNLPGAKVSGGVSNLSFSFRGNNKLREAMHTVFLHHCIERGMDMAIVNPATPLDVSTVSPDVRKAIEDVIFCSDSGAADRLVNIAARLKAESAPAPAAAKKAPAASLSIEEMIEKGIDSGLEKRLEEALERRGSAMGVVNEMLMAAMQRVGDEFGAGRMFLPQVVRSASVMKRAIELLTPAIEKENAHASEGARRKFVLATVRGDVHDIGKNIVAVVLRCSGFEVIDLGVMVEPDRIIEALKESGAKYLGLSGLITPSLAEMSEVASRLEREGMTDVMLCVGGATTSDVHTALKIAPLFSGVTIHTGDAARLPVAASTADAGKVRAAHARLRLEYERRMKRRSEVKISSSPILPDPVEPKAVGFTDLDIPVAEVTELINWKMFFHSWQLPASAAGEAERLKDDARAMLEEMVSRGAALRARVGIVPAVRRGNDIAIHFMGEELVLPTLRREVEPKIAVADFLSEKEDWLGLFAVTAGRLGQRPGNDYERLLAQSLADRLVEAATERTHGYVHETLWGIPDRPRSIRPAIGYPSLPDQSLVHELDKLLHYADLGVAVTENGALQPSATTTGLIFASASARYFDVGSVSASALREYAAARKMPEERLRALLGARVQVADNQQ